MMMIANQNKLGKKFLAMMIQRIYLVYKNKKKFFLFFIFKNIEISNFILSELGEMNEENFEDWVRFIYN